MAGARTPRWDPGALWHPDDGVFAVGGGGVGAATQKPVLLCYDGSGPAARALEQAGTLLTGSPAIVLTSGNLRAKLF
jgi:hypothetical protein